LKFADRGRIMGQQEVVQGSPPCSLTTLRGFLFSRKPANFECRFQRVTGLAIEDPKARNVGGLEVHTNLKLRVSSVHLFFAKLPFPFFELMKLNRFKIESQIC
jgi:hypothetical protein